MILETPEYQASEWLMTIHNAYRELDFAIANSPQPAGLHRTAEKSAFAAITNRTVNRWAGANAPRDIADRSPECGLPGKRLKLPNL